MIYNLNKFSNAKLICVQIFEVKFGGGEPQVKQSK